MNVKLLGVRKPESLIKWGVEGLVQDSMILIKNFWFVSLYISIKLPITTIYKNERF